MSTRWFLVLLAFVSVSQGGSACNIPVFRYALERWTADPFEFVVFYDQDLSDEQQRLLAGLTPDRSNGETQLSYGHTQTRSRGPSNRHPTANVKVVPVHISDTDSPYHALWQSLQADPTNKNRSLPLPYVVVRSQVGPRVINAWRGPLTPSTFSHMIDSPVRRELTKRILAGHSIVWLMIRSGNESNNQQARKLIESNLAPLADQIELPEGIGLPGSELHSELPLLVKFSMIEIDADDPQERFLIDMLTGFQPEAIAAGDPLVIPVFGRGRALEVIPASQLNAQLLRDLSGFLSGACSCQVKEQNPGFDLLLSVDWNSKLFGPDGQPPAPRTTRDRQRPTLLTIPPGRK